MTNQEFKQLFNSIAEAVVNKDRQTIIELLNEVSVKDQKELFLTKGNMFVGTIPFLALRYPIVIPALFANFPNELLNEVLSAIVNGNTIFAEIISSDKKDAFKAIILDKPKDIVLELLMQTDYKGTKAEELISGDCKKILSDYLKTFDPPIQTETSNATNSIQQNFSTLSHVDSFHNAASQSAAITLFSRFAGKIYNSLSVPSALQYGINMAAMLGVATRMVYEPVSLFVSSATYMFLHSTMPRFNFNQRTIRQATSILTITNLAALELYNSSSSEDNIENGLNLVATASGATLGVIGTDLLLDGAEKFIGHCYEKYSASNAEDSISDSDFASKRTSLNKM
jgi:hypothetical protein